MNYKDFSDEELISLICEESGEAKDVLYAKYKYIIDILLRKYSYAALCVGIEYQDLYQEALVGFSDAILNYREDQNAALPTFISLCVSRRLQKIIAKAGRPKNKIITDSLSLDKVYEGYTDPLSEMISDDWKNDPLYHIETDEGYEELSLKIKDSLSASEYEVFSLMINGLKYNEIANILNKTPKQIDNAMQRIRGKVRELLAKEDA